MTATRRLGVVRFGPFGNGGVVLYTPPTSTIDPRYEACTDHRVACDCREAEHAELVRELTGDRNALQAAIDQQLAGHPTRVEGDGTPCQCTGCVIARAAHMLPREIPW